MIVDLNRIKKTIEDLSTFNSTPDKGITRFSYSVEDQKARNYLITIMQGLGLQNRIDAVGNIRARMEGKVKDAPVIMTGSHLDTVLHGGMFDGVVGVVGALEVLRVLIDNKIETNHPLELIIFVEEEGSNFSSAMAGSKTLTGKYDLQDLKTIKNFEGITMYEMAKKAGYHPDRYQDDVLKSGEIKVMLEMHVEQSVVLDSKNTSIGIVEAIVGSKWLTVELKGTSNHAGATPMHLRKDPMVGAARVIAEIEDIVRHKAFYTTVGTVGRIICQPNVPNVIPASVSFTVDIRDVDPQGIQTVEEEIRQLTEIIAGKYDLQAEINLMGSSDPIKLSPWIINLFEKMSISQNLNYLKMNSGAIHDACILASITDVGMIFVPSKDGRSHVPEERTEYKDIQRGCDLLLKTILNIDGVVEGFRYFE